jgi:hypothetical protein
VTGGREEMSGGELLGPTNGAPGAHDDKWHVWGP